MISSYFKIEILAIQDEFVLLGHKGLIVFFVSVLQVSFLDVCSLQVADNALGTLRGSTKEDPLLTLPAPEKPAPVSAIAFNSSK